jgi:hypothetical protein
MVFSKFVVAGRAIDLLPFGRLVPVAYVYCKPRAKLPKTGDSYQISQHFRGSGKSDTEGMEKLPKLPKCTGPPGSKFPGTSFPHGKNVGLATENGGNRA